MAGESNVTTDHAMIKRWVEERGGEPARVKGSGDMHDAGTLRFDFDEADRQLEPISWGDFFETLDHRSLALVYQDTTLEGDTSRFFEFVPRDKAHEEAAEITEAEKLVEPADDGS